jgi:cytochrome b561
MTSAQHWRNTAEGYGWISIALHWVSFVLVLFLLVEGAWMVTLTYYDPLYHTLPHWHKVAGVTIVLLTVVRLAWRLTNPRPALLPAPSWQHWSARLVHLAFYVALVALAVTGYVITTAKGKPIELFWGWQIPAWRSWPSDLQELHGFLHRWIAYGMAVLMVLHAGAALFHHFIQHDSTLRRMLRPPRH